MTRGATLEAVNITKHFPGVSALTDVSLKASPGEVLCLLGDNGAGKSTLIKVLSGVHQPDSGELLVDGEPVRFHSARDARDLGIATVFQDLAMIPLMPVVGNFFLGREPSAGRGPFRHIDWSPAEEITLAELSRVGIKLKSARQSTVTLSGGQRQSVAIARAMYFGASVLILDEPTSALGVHEASIVLRLTARAREDGLAIIFISHNVSHAIAIGDRFTVLRHGRNYAEAKRGEITREELMGLMAGDEEGFDLMDREMETVDNMQPQEYPDERILHGSISDHAEDFRHGLPGEE